MVIDDGGHRRSGQSGLGSTRAEHCPLTMARIIGSLLTSKLSRTEGCVAKLAVALAKKMTFSLLISSTIARKLKTPQNIII